MNRLKARVALLIGAALGAGFVVFMQAHAESAVKVDADGAVHVPAFVLPESSYLSEESRAALKQARGRQVQGRNAYKACGSLEGTDRAALSAIRKCQAEAFYTMPLYQSMRNRYAVTLTPQEIGGVHTEVFLPKGGIAQKNEQRVLINVHGGGFFTGSRTASHLESIPIASLGKIKIISIDYRMAPEHAFPAASEDVAAVYREVLRQYKPANIGIYGCSAGGALTAQSMAWFQKEKLPLPAAIGLFCFGAGRALGEGKDLWVRSDSGRIDNVLTGRDHEKRTDIFLYYRGVDIKNPLASPGDYDEVMAKFPPSLLIGGGRDALLSSVIVTHAQLVRLGVEADLHVWEGMTHAFQLDPALPESREAYDVIVKFFDRHLGENYHKAEQQRHR